MREICDLVEKCTSENGIHVSCEPPIVDEKSRVYIYKCELCGQDVIIPMDKMIR